MSTYTILKTDIVFSGETLDTKYKVEDEIEKCKSMIKYLENELLVLCVTTEPQKAFAVEDGDPIDEVIQRYRNTVEELEGEYIRKYKLETLLEVWDKCHNDEGKAIAPPKGTYDSSFLSGDFIETDREIDFDE